MNAEQYIFLRKKYFGPVVDTYVQRTYNAAAKSCSEQKLDQDSCIKQLEAKIISNNLDGFAKFIYQSAANLLENAPQHIAPQHPCGLTFPPTIRLFQLVHCAPIQNECLKTHKSYIDAVLYSTYAESQEQCTNIASALSTIEAKGFGPIIKATALALSAKLSQTSNYIAQHPDISITRDAPGECFVTESKIFLKSTKPDMIVHEMTHLALAFTDDNFGHPKDPDQFKKEVIIPRLADPNNQDLSSESIFESMSKGCTPEWDGIIECDITNHYKPHQVTVEFPAFLVQELFQYDKLDSNEVGIEWVKDWFRRIEQLDDHLIGKTEAKEAH